MKLNLRVAGDRVVWVRVLLLSAVLLIAAVVALRFGQRVSHLTASHPSVRHVAVAPTPESRQAVVSAHVPLNFEANKGQADAQVKFLSRGSGYALFLTSDEAVLKLRSVVPRQHSVSSESRKNAVSAAVLRMKLLGASQNASVSGESELPGKSNYLIGNDPGRWQTGVSQYARVRYRQIYPGIDLIYYGKGGQLEYDFEIAPGVDPKQIQLSFAGASHLRLASDGDLVADTAAGEVRLHTPSVFQEINGLKKPVQSKLEISGLRAQFQVGEYDHSQQLIIDPTVTFSTYLGGSGNEGCLAITGAVVPHCPSIALDGALNMYVAGTTDSADFPKTAGVFQTALNGTAADVFVTKYNSSGTQILFSTYLGGSGLDYPVGIAVNPFNNNVYVAGNTTSSDFPVKNAFQNSPLSVNNHAFVSVLNASGTALVYSTYLSGHGADTATGVATDNRGGAYVTGFTTSTDSGTGFPSLSTAFQVASRATSQFFFTRINTAGVGGPSLAYSSYLGGSASPSGNPANETQGGAIAVDASGLIYVTGGTDFTDMPILNAQQTASGGGVDAFVAKFNPFVSGASGRLYLTYLGGSGTDVGNGIAVDSAGNAYVTGATSSAITIPSGTTPYQPCLNSASAAAGSCPSGTTNTDAFLAKFGAPVSGSTVFPLNYFSYIGGSGNDAGLAIVVDVNQMAHVSGVTASGDFHVSASPYTPFQGALSGSTDAFLAQIPTTTTTGAYATYLGGSGDEAATGIATDGNGSSYLAGETSSPSDFPTKAALQGFGGGTADAFVSKFTPVSNIAFSVTPSASVIGRGNQVTFNYSIANTGSGTDAASNVILTATLPAGATFNTASATPGSCTAVVNATVTCSLGTLGIGSTGKVALSVTPTVFGAVTSTATVTANGAPLFQSSTVAVTDYSVSASPATTTVAAGNSATYQVSVNPSSSGFPNSVSLGCSAGLPTGASCTFSTNPVTPNASAVSSTLTVATTARPVTTGALGGSRVLYAALLPISGLAYLGFGLGASRRRKVTMVLLVVLMLSFAGLQLACGGGSGTSTTTTGTPAGTYSVTLTATSGSISHTTRIFLVVQ